MRVLGPTPLSSDPWARVFKRRAYVQPGVHIRHRNETPVSVCDWLGSLLAGLENLCFWCLIFRNDEVPLFDKYVKKI